MGRHNSFSFLILTLAFISNLSHGQLKQIPRYSLENMPETKFSCRDKIIGGYYADPETQCQMFHVCVKVAGVGIQDFRFLCPNGTAFDQEAQICADWGDIDCETATVYYGSGNFDLYRIGTGFDSKRAPPPAEEEESEFHLQRAETSDARRSKQFVVNQISRNDKPVVPARNIVVSPRPFQTTPAAQPSSFKTEAPVPVSTYRASPVSFYSPTPPPPIVVRNEQRPQPAFTREDDIFKGSYSSNFFGNRNGKDDDDYSQHPNNIQVHPRPTTTSTTSTTTRRPTTSTTTTTTQRPLIQNQATKPRNRGRGHIKAKATADPHFLASYGIKKQDYQEFKPQQYSSSSQQFTTVAPIHVPEIIRNKPSKAFTEFDKFNKPLKADKFQFTSNSVAPPTAAPAKIYPSFNYNTTLPASSPSPFQKSYDTTTTFKPPTPFQINGLDRNSPPNRFYNTKYETTSTDSFTTAQPFSRSQYITNTPIIDAKPSTYNPGSFNRFAPRDNSRSTVAQIDLTTTTTSPQQQRFEKTQIITARPPSEQQPRYQQPVSRSQDIISSYTPSTAKKFSTLVPKENYNPTTFKPHISHTIKRTDSVPLKQIEYKTTFIQTTTTTAAPLPEGDEDDGLYRPELYEKDLYKNKLKAKLARSRTSHHSTKTTKKSDNINDDDELFNTAQSQNIAASGNELRAERARQAVKEINKILENASKSSSTTVKSLTKSKHEDKDASYDYAYYDLGEHQNEFDTYSDIIEEFGKTKTKS